MADRDAYRMLCDEALRHSGLGVYWVDSDREAREYSRSVVVVLSGDGGEVKGVGVECGAGSRTDVQ